ncbi:unnamed protein product, partial [Rotaria sordida]
MTRIKLRGTDSTTSTGNLETSFINSTAALVQETFTKGSTTSISTASVSITTTTTTTTTTS